MNKQQQNKKMKMKISYFITLFVGVAFAYFMWLSWSKLTDWIGNSWYVWGITGGIVLIGIYFSFFSFEKVAKRFV